MYKTNHTFRTTLLTLLMACCLHTTAVAAPGLFDVEVIIFSHNSQSDHGESWHTPDDGADRAGGYMPGNRFTDLSSSHHQLGPVRHSLQQGGAYTVLFHRAWRQPASSPSNTAGYPVRSRNGVEGSVRLVRGRYLHLDVGLLLKKASGSAPGTYSDDPGNNAAYRLKEKRRIKSGELHYFDHPRFGMLALVRPYKSPAEVTVSTPSESPAPESNPATESAPATATDQQTN